MTYYKLIAVYFILIGTILIISKKLNLVDIPVARKLHKINVVNTSGIAIYIFYLIIVTINELSPQLETIIIYGSIIVFCGFIDDRINLSPGIKFFLTTFPIIYLIHLGFKLDNLGTYEFIGKIELGKFGFLFTALACSLLMHSYNYTDGIDGLLLLTTLVSLVFGALLVSEDYSILKLISFLIIPIIVSLCINFLPNKSKFKMFVGDSGSLFFGFFISFFMIFLFKYKNIHPAILIWMVWYPVYDFLYVTILRIKKKKKIYVADKAHTHHKLLKIFNNNHFKTSFFITSIIITITYLGYYIAINIGKIFSLLAFILLFFLFSFIRRLYLN